jgi:hypothetical protein
MLRIRRSNILFFPLCQKGARAGDTVQGTRCFQSGFAGHAVELSRKGYGAKCYNEVRPLLRIPIIQRSKRINAGLSPFLHLH